MNCPICNTKADVLDTRKNKFGNLERRRACRSDVCGYTFFTHEVFLRVAKKQAGKVSRGDKVVPVQPNRLAGPVKTTRPVAPPAPIALTPKRRKTDIDNDPRLLVFDEDDREDAENWLDSSVNRRREHYHDDA